MLKVGALWIERREMQACRVWRIKERDTNIEVACKRRGVEACENYLQININCKRWSV